MLNDEILVSGSGGRIYSIINARLELKYENNEIIKPFISDNVLYHYTKQSGSYNLINTETKETVYTESDVYRASVIAGHTFVNQQVFSLNNTLYEVTNIDEINPLWPEGQAQS